MAAEQAAWASWVRHGQGELRVGARSFEVTALACENPECPCEELTLCFREQAPPARQAALAFDVYVDLAGDAPPGTKGLGAEADRLAAKVAREVGGPGRATLRDALRDKRMRLRTVDETVMAYSRRGETVPWCHVRAGGRPDDKETWGLLDTFDDGARDWDVLDYICANPSCDCEEVKLAFHGLDEDGARAHIGVRVPFGEGPPRFEQPEGVTLAEARAAFAAWEAATHIDRATLRNRYDTVRAIARRHAPPPATSRPLGRRDPCPCGSGKRYKNCCGRDPG